MARLSNSRPLPSPEEYGRKLAEHRARASRVPEILKALASMNQRLERQSRVLDGLPFEDIASAIDTEGRVTRDAMAAMPLADIQAAIDALRQTIAEVREEQKRIGAQIQSLPSSVLTLPTPAPVDLGVTHSKLDELLARPRTEVRREMATGSKIPDQLDITVTARDAQGNIQSARVDVQ